MIPFLTLFWKEILRFWKVVIQTVVTPLVSSSLYLVVFGVSLGSAVKVQGNIDYLVFLVPGLMMMGLMNNAFQNSSTSIVVAKYTGELHDLKVVPITELALITALALGAVVRGATVALVTYLVGSVMHWWESSEWILPSHPLVLIYFMVVAGLAFGMIGIAAASWAKSFDQMGAISAFVILPLTYFGGVFLSFEHMSEFWRSVAVWNPVLYFVNGLRYGLLGFSDVPLSSAMILSLVSVVVLTAIARYSLSRGSFQRW